MTRIGHVRSARWGRAAQAQRIERNVSRALIVPERLRWLARVVPWWTAVMAATLAAGLIEQHDRLSQLCTTGDCDRFRLDPAAASRLDELGLTPDGYAWTVTVTAVLFASVLFGLGVLVWRRARRECLPLVVAFVFPALAATFYLPASMVGEGLWFGTPLGLAFLVNRVSLLPVLALFPDGRWCPRWTRWPVVAWVLFSAVTVGAELADHTFTEPVEAIGALVAVGGFVVLIVGQTARYRHHADRFQRSQIRWVLVGIGAMFAAALSIAAFALVAGPPRTGSASWLWVELVTGAASSVLFGALTAALIRARLWGVDLAVNRLLVWGISTFALLLAYACLVLLAADFGSNRTGIPIIAAAALVAAGFQPLRWRVQTIVDRAMYGSRNDPAALTTSIAGVVDDLQQPARLLEAIAERIARDLRLPGVEISVVRLDGDTIVGSFGDTSAGRSERPLRVGAELIGSIALSRRRGQRRFGRRDDQTIDVVTHQVAALAGLLRVAHDRDSARLDVIAARDLERRRLRRDLHDGLGPTLASVIQRVDAAHHNEPDQAALLLTQAGDGLRDALAEMRRIVYDLRPPELDRHGFAASLRHKADIGALPLEVEVIVDAPDGTVPLPETIETAFHRISEEALLNAARHGNASRAVVTLTRSDIEATIEIVDDGSGIDDGFQPGVGVTSMHERVQQLGGRLDVARSNGCGTSVRASVPVPRGMTTT